MFQICPFFYNCTMCEILRVTEDRNSCWNLDWEIIVIIFWKSFNEQKFLWEGHRNFSKDWVSSGEYEVGRASLLFVFSYAEAISPCWPDTALANTIHNENQCHQVTKQLLCLLKCTSLQKQGFGDWLIFHLSRRLH